jgi:hypothetical protein
MWMAHARGHRCRQLGGRLVTSAFMVGAVVLAMAEPAVGLAQGWSIVHSPNRSPGNNELLGVSCVSAWACTAVGDFTISPAGTTTTLIESWNGTRWKLVPSPNPVGPDNELHGVSCVSASACTAVGLSVGSNGATSTLIESWNGTKWSIVPSPNLNGFGALYGVSCVSATACTAVGGGASSSDFFVTLIESWNGSAWSIVPSPSPGTITNEFLGVSCVSASACTAVGDYGYRSGPVRTLIESWNGTTWSVAPSPNRAEVNSFLFGVSCVSPTACTAVGTRTPSAGAKTVIDSWNGTTWSLVPSPNVALADNELTAVSCLSARACTAVGEHDNGYIYRTLIESWNGTKWSMVSSPNLGVDTNLLYGVSCRPKTGCTAAGYYGAPFTTLIEQKG